MACKLDNGTCGFSQKACVGNNPPTCGINFIKPGTCSNNEKTHCWKDQNCGKGGTCKATDPDHQHINKTCGDLLTDFQSKVVCNPGYHAAVSSSGNYQGTIKSPTERQPCAFVCNPNPPCKKDKDCKGNLMCKQGKCLPHSYQPGKDNRGLEIGLGIGIGVLLLAVAGVVYYLMVVKKK